MLPVAASGRAQDRGREADEHDQDRGVDDEPDPPPQLGGAARSRTQVWKRSVSAHVAPTPSRGCLRVPAGFSGREAANESTLKAT